jgi:hypothetical protein
MQLPEEKKKEACMEQKLPEWQWNGQYNGGGNIQLPEIPCRISDLCPRPL